MVHSRKCKNRDGKTKSDQIPTINKGETYLLVKRELDGKLRVDICQTCEGDKGNEGESKKEREFPPIKREEKPVPLHIVPSGLFQAQEKNRG